MICVHEFHWLIQMITMNVCEHEIHWLISNDNVSMKMDGYVSNFYQWSCKTSKRQLAKAFDDSRLLIAVKLMFVSCLFIKLQKIK